MVCLNKTNKLTIAGGIKPIHNSYTSHHSTGGGCSKLPNLTKLAKGAVTSLIIFSTIISICTPILVNLTGVSATTIDSTTSTNTSSSNPSSQSSQSSPSDPNYLTNALETNGIDTSTLNTNTNEVDPTTMASDLASLNNALATQAANEGISISLTNSNNQPITTTNPVTIDIDPSNATGSGVTTNSILSATSITANVKTAMPGYSLSISTNLDNNSLTNTDSTLGNTQNGSAIQSTAGTQDSPTTLSANTWGYAMNRDSSNEFAQDFDTNYTVGTNNPTTSKWAKVPTSQTPETIKHTEDTPQESGDNTTVYYGVNVPKNKTAGQYRTTITYTATANILDPPEVEKVEPGTIRQNVQVVAAPIGQDSESTAVPMMICYLTNAGEVYCGSRHSNAGVDYGAAIKTLAPHYSDSPLWYSSTPEGAYSLVEAGTFTTSMGFGNEERPMYWLKIDTSKLDGKVIQMAVVAKDGASQYQAYGVACYLTDHGNVYCSNGSYSSGTDVNDSAIQAIEYVAPSAYDMDTRTYVGQFSTLLAGNASDGSPYYWIEVNTDLLEGDVVQIIPAPIGQNSQGYAVPMMICYLTDAGKVYCGGGHSNTGSDYGAAIKTLTSYYSDSSLWNAQVPEGAYSLREAGTYTTSMGFGYEEATMYWLEIDTSEFDGKVVQVTVAAKDGGSQYEADGFACYLTDKGSVYCSNGSGASGTDVDENAIDSVQYVAPSARDWSNNKYVGEFLTVPAGTTSSGNQYYWVKVDTDLMKGSVVQIVAAPIGQNSDGYETPMIMCYITDQGKVYCGGRNDGTNDYGAAIKTLTSHYSDNSLWNSQVPDGAYSMIEAGKYTQSIAMGGGQQSYYWLEIDTKEFDGKVVQMAVVAKDGDSTNTAYGVACYLTDKGSVYCSNGSYASGTDVNNSAIQAVEYVTPSAYDLSARTYVGQFSTRLAGNTSSGNPYYWIKVNTDLFEEGGMADTAGTTITLTGNNLSKVTNVYIDTNNNSALDEGTDIAVSNLKITSDTQLTFTAPSMSPGTYNLIITNPGNVVVKGTLTYR